MNKLFKRYKGLVKFAFQRIVLRRVFNKVVTKNPLLIADIEANYIAYECTTNNKILYRKFEHLVIHYPAFNAVFLFRTSYGGILYRFAARIDNFSMKIFKSSKIAGGLVCFHPYASVVNAKAIGKNFTFRNGLTIGNKGDDNRMALPIIGNNVEVGANVCIIGAITIGNNVTIGSGSVVVKDVPDNAIVAGNPARLIRMKSVV